MQSVQQINKSFHQQSNRFHFIQTKFKLFYNQLKIMNQIYIGQEQHLNIQPNTFYIKLAQSDKYLQILRSDHFSKITIQLPQNINDKQLRFMMHLSRILKQKGQIRLINSQDTQSAQLFSGLALKLGLFDNRDRQNKQYFSKQKVQRVQQTKTLQIKKTAIGFQSNQTEQIDEEQLMKNENINIQKSKVQNCAQKPKACANCNCGRKNNEQPIVPKQKLIESINDGKPVSGCGKCFLGDSFRCGSCPYKGLPAFKPGDKLKLMQEGQVVVQANEVKVQSGKIKIQL